MDHTILTLDISLTVGSLVFIVVLSFFIRRSVLRQQVRSRMKDLHEKAVETLSENEQSSFRISLNRIFRQMVQLVSGQLRNVTPQTFYAILRTRIVHAGKQDVWNPYGFISIMLLSGIAFVIFGFFMVNARGIQAIVLMALLAMGGMFVPWFLLSMIISRRKEKINIQLSDIMDLISVSVQAGLSFDAALTSVIRRMRGPMIDECQRMLQDVQMGMTHKQALKNMAQRCDVESVYLFTAAVIQSETLGGGMTNTLQVQADNVRDRHRQMVREKVMKLPVKLIFPLALFIFPTIFLVVLGPIILKMMTTGGALFAVGK